MATKERNMYMFCEAMLDAAIEADHEPAVELWNQRAEDAYLIYMNSEEFYGYAEISKHFGYSEYA